MLRKCSGRTLTVLWKASPPRQPGEAGGGLQRVCPAAMAISCTKPSRARPAASQHQMQSWVLLTRN